MLQKLKDIGPGAMVAAAFIGPGTVTTASLAGSSYGYTLLWAVVFSIISTCILQEMSARLGVVAGIGIGTALRKKLSNKISKIIVFALVIAAIFIGNAAYEAGNISGVLLGSELIMKEQNVFAGLPIVIGLIAAVLLFTGKYQVIERILVILVALMGVSFIIVAIHSKPDFLEVLKGMFIPRADENAFFTVLALIGTTVVPYNLFLHASSAKEKWNDPSKLKTARTDTYVSIIIGGFITLAIIIAVASITEGTTNVIDKSNLYHELGNLLSSSASILMGIGFVAAGLTSAITAPLAASFAVTELFGKSESMKSYGFRIVWLSVLLVGIVFSMLPDAKPAIIILFAQFTNGLLLPLVAVLLIWVMNDRKFLGEHKNSLGQNILAIFITIICLALGLKAVLASLSIV